MGSGWQLKASGGPKGWAWVPGEAIEWASLGVEQLWRLSLGPQSNLSSPGRHVGAKLCWAWLVCSRFREAASADEVGQANRGGGAGGSPRAQGGSHITRGKERKPALFTPCDLCFSVCVNGAWNCTDESCPRAVLCPGELVYAFSSCLLTCESLQSNLSCTGPSDGCVCPPGTVLLVSVGQPRNAIYTVDGDIWK